MLAACLLNYLMCVCVFFKAARKDKTGVPSVQETVKKIIRGQVRNTLVMRKLTFISIMHYLIG